MSPPSLRQITVAIDGSPNGEVALEYAIDLALHYRAELVVLSVAPIVPVYISSTEPLRFRPAFLRARSSSIVRSRKPQ